MPTQRLLVPFLLLVSGAVCFAQNDAPLNNGADPNSVQRAITRARNDGRIVDAENLLRDAIHQLEQDNPRSPRLAQYLKELAVLARRREGEAAAVPLMKQAYEIELANFGPSDLRVGMDLVLLASYTHASDVHEAERQINEAIDIVRPKEADLRWNQGAGVGAGILVGAVKFYMDEQRWVDAELLMPEMMKLCKTIPDDFYFGFCGRPDQTLAEIYRGEGKTVPDEKPLPFSNLPAELAPLNESAQKYAKDRLYPSAEETYQKAIQVAAKIDAEHGPYSGVRVMEMNDLGKLYVDEGLKDRAEKTFVSALDIGEQEARAAAASKSGNVMAAAGLSPWPLVNLYRNEDRLPDAEAVVRRVLEVQTATLGERHRAIVQNLMELADICAEEGKQQPAKLVDARANYERAIAMEEANMGPNDPSVVGPLQRYANFLSSSNDPAKAAEVRARIATIEAHQFESSK